MKWSQVAITRRFVGLAIVVVLAISAFAAVGAMTGESMTNTSQLPPAPSALLRTATVKGTVTYREMLTLPDSAVLTVQLLELVAADDGPAAVVGEPIIRPANSPAPFEFKIPYDPESIRPDGDYAVAAQIIADGKLLAQTMTTLVTLAVDHPTVVDVVLDGSASRSSLEPGLSYGRLAQFSY